MRYYQKLKKLRACSIAVEWSKNYSAQKAWDICERGDWMLWLKAKQLIGIIKSREDKRWKEFILVVCKCARLSWKWMPEEGKNAILITEKWAKKGEKDITINNVIKAASCAVAAASCAATYVSWAAAYASYAVAAAACASYATAASCADAASYAADAALKAATNKKRILKRCANIVRKAYPKAPRI